MMKKDLSKKVTLSLLVGSMLFANSYAFAAENYYGNEKTNTPSGNTATVADGEEYRDVYAAVTNGVDAKNNVATMTGGKAEYLAGAATDYGDVLGGSAIENGVEMSGGEAKEVVGGEAYSGGEVTDNYVNMSGGTAQNVYGGITSTGAATGNKVNISGDAVVTGSGENGYEEDGEKTTNAGVYGAMSVRADNEGNLGTLSQNEVTISGNAKVSSVYGAYSESDSKVTGNKIIINSGTTGVVEGSEVNKISGGYSKTGDVIENIVEINGGTINNFEIFGGSNGVELYEEGVNYDSPSNVNENQVIITGGTINTNGGYIKGGSAETGNANANVVKISNVESINVGEIVGGITGENGTANGNSVTIGSEDKKLSFDATNLVAGGWSENGSASENEVSITNVDFKDTTSDTFDIYGGLATAGAVTGNEVNLSNITIANANETFIAAGNNGFDQNDEGAGGSVGEVSNNTLTINGTLEGTDLHLYGGYVDYANGDAVNNHVVIGTADGTKTTVNDKVTQSDEKDMNAIYGGYSEGTGIASQNTVTVNNADITIGEIYGGYSESGKTEGNIVTISDTVTNANIFGGYSEGSEANNNTVALTNVTINNYQTTSYNPDGIDVYAGIANDGAVSGNTLIIDNLTIERDGSEYGQRAEDILAAGANGGEDDGSERPSVGAVTNNTVRVIGDIKSAGLVLYGGYIDYADGEVIGNQVIIDSGDGSTVHIEDTDITNDENGTIYGGYTEGSGIASGNSVIVKTAAIRVGDIYGGYSESGTAENNTVELKGVRFDSDTNVYGGFSKSGNVTDNNVIISGDVEPNEGAPEDLKVDVYGGYSETGTATNNKVTLYAGANVENVNLHGANVEGGNNELVIGEGVGNNSWSGTVNSVSNFSRIAFNNVKWQAGGTVLTIADTANSNLTGTVVDADGVNFDATSDVNVGESMTFVAAANGQKPVEGVSYEFGKYTVGTMYEGNLSGDAENGVAAIETKEVASQNNLLAENRAVAAAFVNQGSDLISDSLDTLSRDGNYGVKTFAAVYGNRSKYDVNSDIKINGWSVIAGVGSEKELQNGDFSWGVFYENGSGNYRTYNEFNNEFFRGDGSVVYNGGGIAARYEQNNGVYTEASLRAGMLKSEMDNALKDGSGNSYGYDSDTAYYGAHIGIGKVISLTESTDLDVYGKFFHTYNDGDTVTIGNGNKYEFDSITSDRLRVGARITTNKENKFSTYYGLAYEYEFNGDADMRVGNMRAETQSLQGSSYMAEIGLNYQPSPESPWSFDLNMRGYTGERQGESFNVQATYTF